MEQQAFGRARSANDVSHAIVTAALKVHSALGPGLLESAYEACLMHELVQAGLRVASQVPLPLQYEGITLDRLPARSTCGRSCNCRDQVG